MLKNKTRASLRALQQAGRSNPVLNFFTGSRRPPLWGARDDDVVEFHRDCNNKKGIKGLFILSMNTGSKIEQPLKERRKKFLGPGY